MSAKTGTPSLPAVVLAGGRAKPELEAVIGQKVRALAVVHGKTLLAHVVDALRAADPERSITVIGDVPPAVGYTVRPDTGDFVSNLFAGISVYADAPYVLIATSDLPYLTGEAVADFAQSAVEMAQQQKADLIYPVVPVAHCYARFPGVKRTALRLREGEYTGGNLMLASPRFLLDQRVRIAGAYAARKSPLRLAAILGFGTLWRLLLSQKVSPHLLTVPLLEAQVSRVLGGEARALISAYPEIATDLDRPSDFQALLPEGGAS